MRDPGNDPLEHLRITVVVPAQSSRLARQRPGVHDGEAGADQERDGPVGDGGERGATSVHGEARLRISVISMSIATELCPPCGTMMSA